MVSARLILLAEEASEFDYVMSRLRLHKTVSIDVVKYKSITTIDIVSESKCIINIVRGIVRSVILTFYKYKIMTSDYVRDEELGLKQDALTGALLSFDKDHETEIIDKAIGEGNSFSINSIFEFKLEELKNSWLAAVEFSDRLISQITNESDFYDLIFFILVMNTGKASAPVVKLERLEEGIKLYVDGIESPIPKLTDDEYRNTIMAVVNERPESIIINDPKKFSAEFVKVVRGLGSDNYKNID